MENFGHEGKRGARQGDRAWIVRDREGDLRAVKGKEMRVKKERMEEPRPLVLEMKSLLKLEEPP